jgi:sulfur relay (sulfurtransferase) DsrF/TusC family protein
MSDTITVVIREDPLRSGRAVEALRIALGLGAGERPISVVLLDKAPQLLSENRDEVVDLEILDKYLPSFQHLETEFLVAPGAIKDFSIEAGFRVTETAPDELRRHLTTARRVLVF